MLEAIHTHDIESRKASALRVLAPLGFLDNEDSDVPGAIWHPATGVVIDSSRINPRDVIRVVFEAGEREGREVLQTKLCQLLGVISA